MEKGISYVYRKNRKNEIWTIGIEVSESAAIVMANVLDEIGLKIAKEAIDYTKHAGRKTVKDRDIKIAAKKLVNRTES